jgi:DNA-binding MarR family transcriptional regulator
MMLLLKSVRRIVRASDLGSRSLQKSAGLTAPQLAVLTAIATLGEVSTTRIARDVDLSTATVVTIIDNLERHGLVTRHRSSNDRRIVHPRLTDAAAAILLRAHGPFGETFSARFAGLPEERRRDMLRNLAALADLMGVPDDKK